MQNRKEIYYNYFEQNILPVIKPLEQERVKTLRKVIFTSFLFFISGIVFAGLFIINAMYSVFNPLVLPVLLFLMYAFIIKSIINVMLAGKLYQNMLVEKVLPLFFEPVAKFRKWPQKDLETVVTSKLFENFDELEESLCFFGFYNNTAIRISDTRLSLPVRGSEKSYLFKGTVIKLELPKSIDNHVILISKDLRKVNNYKQFNPHVNELNKYLYCFAAQNTDVVTEDFWKIIKKFGKLYTAKSFALSYRNNVLLIALRQKTPFQFGFLFKSLLKAENYDELIDRFTIVYEFVDFLNN